MCCGITLPYDMQLTSTAELPGQPVACTRIAALAQKLRETASKHVHMGALEEKNKTGNLPRHVRVLSNVCEEG